MLAIAIAYIAIAITYISKTDAWSEAWSHCISCKWMLKHCKTRSWISTAIYIYTQAYLIALVCEHMAYKFCDYKVTGEDHLVSKYIWHTVTARLSYGLVGKTLQQHF